MVKGLKRSLERGQFSGATPTGGVAVLKVRDGTLTVDGATGVGFGSLVIGDFPQGNILIHGAVAYMTFVGPTSADLDDDWEGDYGIGTTPAGDATLSTTDINIVSSTAIAAATAEASPRTRATSAVADLDHIVDNTDGSLEVNLSLLIDDANIGADGIDMTVDGELYLEYSILGDD